MTSSRSVRLWSALSVASLAAAGCGDDTAGTGGGGGSTVSASSGSGATSTNVSASSGSTGDGGAASSGAAGGDTGVGGAGGQGGSAIAPRFQEVADAATQELEELGAPGGAIAIIENGEVTFAHGFGDKSPGGGDPVDAETLFRIGSVNKMLTAAALLGEVDRGTVELDAPITDVVTDFELFEPAWAPSIQVRHLLEHSAAMNDYLEIDTPASQHTDDALHDFVTGSTFRSRVYLMAPPGAFFNYSNPNFYLAGLVAETAANMPYRALMADHVFGPLGMERTYFLSSEVLADGNFALGVTTTPGVPSPVEPDTYENAWGRPAGYATSSVLDLAKMAQFLLGGNEDVMSESLWQEMTSPQRSTRDYANVFNYGHSVEIYEGYFIDDEFYDQRMVRHGGDIPGFAAEVVVIRESGFGFIALASADGAHLTDTLDTALRTLAPLPEPSAPPDVSVTTAELDSFTGTYQDDFNVGEVIVTRSGGGLRISMPALDDLDIPYGAQLQHFARETFVLSVQGIYTLISFVNDAQYARTRFFVAARSAPENAADGSGDDAGDASPAVAARAMTVADPARRARIVRAIEAAARHPESALLPSPRAVAARADR